MTSVEFLNLKQGDFVRYESGGIGGDWYGEIIDRKIIAERIGFLVSSQSCQDIKTGRKFIELSVRCFDGSVRYINSSVRGLPIAKLHFDDLGDSKLRF
ncbi:hypothetical protein FACS1894211_02570 [Clostridia bacterium]|nr:hypothetical protein FACS1894211_02570 [Clostridia bacterium]